MRVRVTIADGNMTLVLDHNVNTSSELIAGVRVAIREFQRDHPGVPLDGVSVTLETLTPGPAQMWL